MWQLTLRAVYKLKEFQNDMLMRTFERKGGEVARRNRKLHNEEHHHM
jgi:hypothetical protein